MPSFQDSAFIFFLALLLFGPKKLPELARYVGKLMNEFRRASNEFRSQMEEEFRQAEQVEQQKKIAAMEAAAPLAPVQNIPEPEHPHVEPAAPPDTPAPPDRTYPPRESATEPLPIASSGDLHLMPPDTGLPISRTPSSGTASNSVSSLFDSIPHTPDPAAPEPETTHHA